ncbi:hypothetical protein CARUB_v10013067mg [Capsella rubella]|uniref:Ion transport domain-containing protein n=1 Tax=Capsella rubella TaxID=81985 RepID=R0HJU1_9BRAS|nr:probable cyclic nucleotide-gated ion channel 20, chloroplastic [Capsella rubella]EOA29964.1 hypothetical protein CARUB_v10013067mg [Capsella rubella]
MITSDNEKDDMHMLPISDSSSSTRAFNSRTRNVSHSNPTSYADGSDNSTVVLGYTGPLRTQGRPPLVQMRAPLTSSRQPEPIFLPHPSTTSSDSVGVSTQLEMHPSALEHKNTSDDLKHAKPLRSGTLGVCSDPYCTTCPSHYNHKAALIPHSTGSSYSDSTVHNILDGDATRCDGRFASSVIMLSEIVNPHNKIFKRWSKFFALSCLLAIFIDPVFFFLVKVDQRNKCIRIDWPMADACVAVRSVTDFIFLMNILLQFRLAYVAPESLVVGAGELVTDPKKIALHYLRGKFILDLSVVLPLPQILILGIIPKHLGTQEDLGKYCLRAVVLLQYIPKLCRLLPFLAGQTPTGFIFESAWASFFINLFTVMLAAHVVGSCWYLFGLQRVNQCFRHACGKLDRGCADLIDCGINRNSSDLQVRAASWRDNASAIACFQADGFSYGIYSKTVNLTTHSCIFTRYTYSLFWGFQQISTLAGNQVPNYDLLEALFTMSIIGLGLLLFALLIGNMQIFLQALGKRNMEMTLRRRDVDQWMSHRRLPTSIRKRVRDAERFNWAATRGVNEELLLENMPDDLQKDIRRHLFEFLKKVNIFRDMDDSIIDAIGERLQQRTYIKNTVLHSGGLVEKMGFIVRGTVESTDESGCKLILSEGDVFCEELFTWCLGSSVKHGGTMIDMKPKGLVSNSFVTCISNVVAFWLSVEDLEHVKSLLISTREYQGAIESREP